MVGAVRFELTTSCTRNKRASQATLRPEPRVNPCSKNKARIYFARFGPKGKLIRHGPHPGLEDSQGVGRDFPIIRLKNVVFQGYRSPALTFRNIPYL